MSVTMIYQSYQRKEKENWKVESNSHDKNEYAMHRRNFEKALDHVLVLIKVHAAINFNQKPWLKS